MLGFPCPHSSSSVSYRHCTLLLTCSTSLVWKRKLFTKLAIRIKILVDISKDFIVRLVPYSCASKYKGGVGLCASSLIFSDWKQSCTSAGDCYYSLMPYIFPQAGGVDHHLRFAFPVADFTLRILSWFTVSFPWIIKLLAEQTVMLFLGRWYSRIFRDAANWFWNNKSFQRKPTLDYFEGWTLCGHAEGRGGSCSMFPVVSCFLGFQGLSVKVRLAGYELCRAKLLIDWNPKNFVIISFSRALQ